MVRCLGAMSHSMRISSRMCSGTWPAHERCTRVTSARKVRQQSPSHDCSREPHPAKRHCGECQPRLTCSTGRAIHSAASSVERRLRGRAQRSGGSFDVESLVKVSKRAEAVCPRRSGRFGPPPSLCPVGPAPEPRPRRARSAACCHRRSRCQSSLLGTSHARFRHRRTYRPSD